MIASGKVSLVANIFISFIGAGVLGLPYAFKEAGLLEGFLVMVFVSVCSVKSMLLLIDCKYKVTNVVLNQQNGITNGQISVRITQGECQKIEHFLVEFLIFLEFRTKFFFAVFE